MRAALIATTGPSAHFSLLGSACGSVPRELHQAVVGSSPVGHTLQAAIAVAITLAEETTR